MTTIVSRSVLGCTSIVARARTVMVPRPVSYAFRIPSRPRMMPAVGKSGPGTSRISSGTVTFGFSMTWMAAFTTSPMLCGGMEVAIPTAIPELPLTSRFGKRDGRTRGSFVESSKFGPHATVSLSMSARRKSARRSRRDSV